MARLARMVVPWSDSCRKNERARHTTAGILGLERLVDYFLEGSFPWSDPFRKNERARHTTAGTLRLERRVDYFLQGSLARWNFNTCNFPLTAQHRRCI